MISLKGHCPFHRESGSLVESPRQETRSVLYHCSQVTAVSHGKGHYTGRGDISDSDIHSLFQNSGNNNNTTADTSEHLLCTRQDFIHISSPQQAHEMGFTVSSFNGRGAERLCTMLEPPSHLRAFAHVPPSARLVCPSAPNDHLCMLSVCLTPDSSCLGPGTDIWKERT